MERSLKNILVLSFGFLLLFTAYGGLQSLQVGVYSCHVILPSERLWDSKNSRGTDSEEHGVSPSKIL